jgi:nicotinamide mononucleotide transporter
MSTLLEQLRATSPWEAIGAALGLAYLLLAVRRNLWCWICAFAGTAIYLVLFAQARIYMQALLQVFYLVMAVYGFIDWKRGRSESGEVLIRSWTPAQHALAALAVAAATLVNGWLLTRGTDAVAPYLDSFVTWGSVVTTWMVARRVIENWLYWVIVDGVGAWLFYSQGLLVTTLLFVVYLGIVIHGYFVWRRERRNQPPDQGSHDAPLEAADNVSG